MNKYDYYYTSLNSTRTRLDKMNMKYKINSKENMVTIYSDLNRVELNKIIETI